MLRPEIRMQKEQKRMTVVLNREPEGISHKAPRPSDITSVTLHSGVTKIMEYAFGEASALATVSFAEGLKTIGEGAFVSIERMESITLPPDPDERGFRTD